MTAKFLAFILRHLVHNTKHNAQNSFNFDTKVNGISQYPGDTTTYIDFIGLFTSIPPSNEIDVVHQALLKDSTLSNRTYLSCSQICDLLHLCLDNTYFSYVVGFFDNIMAVRLVLKFR